MTEIPADLADFLSRLDEFIEREIKPLEEEHIEFFDHRREWRRTDWENDGVHRREWLELLAEMRRRSDRAGLYRYALPSSMGGLDGTNFGMAVIRDHLAAKGLGLHNDLQNEASVVGNLVFPLILDRFGTPEQKQQFMAGAITGEAGFGFNLTEPNHGSDATWLETRAVRRRKRLGDQRRQTVCERRGHRRARDRVRPDLGRARRRARDHRLHRRHERSPATRSRTSTGPSTCPQTTPR